MKKANRLFVILICVCLFGVFLVGAIADESPNIYKSMGEYFREATGQGDEKNAASYEPILVAEFRGEKVYQTDVEYYDKINGLSSSSVTNNAQAKQETLSTILKNMVLFYEAERLGFAATHSEVNEMVDNARFAYSLPEGKAILDQYCEGANITVEQYFEYLEDQAPRVIARQKLLDAVGKDICEKKGLTFTKVNPPEEMLKAREAYIDELFAQAEESIVYYTSAN